MPHKSLAAALVAAQAELTAPTKNRTVKVKTDKGSYSFDYSTLDAIVEQTLRPVLPRHGLWFVQFFQDGQMVTRIVHESGETMDCGLPMPNLSSKPQEAGSTITYFKRYSLCAAFGLVAEEDDDANVASGNGYEAQRRAAPSAPPPPVNWKALEDRIKVELSGADAKQIERVKKDHLADMRRAATEAKETYEAIGKLFADARAALNGAAKEKEPA